MSNGDTQSFSNASSSSYTPISVNICQKKYSRPEIDQEIVTSSLALAPADAVIFQRLAPITPTKSPIVTGIRNQTISPHAKSMEINKFQLSSELTDQEKRPPIISTEEKSLWSCSREKRNQLKRQVAAQMNRLKGVKKQHAADILNKVLEKRSQKVSPQSPLMKSIIEQKRMVNLVSPSSTLSTRSSVSLLDTPPIERSATELDVMEDSYDSEEEEGFIDARSLWTQSIHRVNSLPCLLQFENPFSRLKRELRMKFPKDVDYIKEEKIGQGSFSEVFRVMNIETGQPCAMKLISLPDFYKSQSEKSASLAKRTEKEYELFKSFSHKNLVEYNSLQFVQETSFCGMELMMEYCEKGSLKQMIDTFGPLREQTSANYIHETLNGLRFLHGKSIVHRDLKAANLLISNSGKLKICDFGTFKNFGEDGKADEEESLFDLEETFNEVKGSLSWMAPEILRAHENPQVMSPDERFDFLMRGDIWAVGCTFLELVTGNRPWSEVDGTLQLFSVLSNASSPPPEVESCSNPAKQFLVCCCAMDPAERLTAERLFAHLFFYY